MSGFKGKAGLGRVGREVENTAARGSAGGAMLLRRLRRNVGPSHIMELGETDPDSAFGPLVASAVGVSLSAGSFWPVSGRIKTPSRLSQSVSVQAKKKYVGSILSSSGNRALPPSPPPVLVGGGIGPSSGAHWPPSNRREEAITLSNLEKRLGSFRVKNTSSFKKVSATEKRADRDSSNTNKISCNKNNNNSDRNCEGNDVDNRTFLLKKLLKNRPIYILTNNNDTDTDWYTSDFISECLCWHNVYRERHGSPPLVMCPELCSYAQDWANTLAHKNTFYYRPKARDVGQNIYCRLNVKDPTDVTGKEVAIYWYRACKQYDYLKEPKVLHASVHSGHFTQMVWASSRDIGIGIARSRTGKMMVVANYRPRGNVRGEYQKNVLPPLLEFSSIGGSDKS